MTYYATHGLSGKAYKQKVDELLIEQQGRCAICWELFGETYLWGWPIAHESVRKPYLDHSHETGKIRGLLCNDCNRYIIPIENYGEDCKLLAYRWLDNLFLLL